MVIDQSSFSIRRHPTIRLNIFLCNLSSSWRRPLVIGKTTITKRIDGPILASKYFSRSRRDTLWSNNTCLCLWNDAHVALFRFENSIVARSDGDVTHPRQPRLHYLWGLRRLQQMRIGDLNTAAFGSERRVQGFLPNRSTEAIQTAFPRQTTMGGPMAKRRGGALAEEGQEWPCNWIAGNFCIISASIN